MILLAFSRANLARVVSDQCLEILKASPVDYCALIGDRALHIPPSVVGA